MTTWFSGHGWGWCGVMVSTPAMVLLWGAFFTALVLALRSAVRRPRDPAAPTGTRTVWPEGVAVAPTARSETDNDDFYRRLM
jgi:hypothetical protein